MGSNAVGGIDIVVRKKPGGQRLSIHLIDTGQGLVVTTISGADATEYQALRGCGVAIGRLINEALKPNGAQRIAQVTKSLSNIKNN